MKILKHRKLDDNYQVEIKVNKIDIQLKIGEVIRFTDDFTVKVISYDYNTKRIIGMKLQPGIYVMTNESYAKNGKRKVGLVNWQSPFARRDQLDTTWSAEPIRIEAFFELNVYDPRITKKIETEIHKRLGLSRKDKHREFVKASLSKCRKVIIEVIKEFKAKPLPNIVMPTPKYYQKDAAILAADYFKINDRGWIQWACATGKSYEAFWIYESVSKVVKFTNNLVIILVPNRQLVVQTHNDFRHISTAYNHKFWSLKVGDVAGSTNDIGEISAWLNSNTPDNLNVIVSTYQSQHLIADALKVSNMEADFLIYDEVHRLTGEDSKVWRNCLNNELFPAKKRLAMTASPVLYTAQSLGFSGLENEKMFGKCFHRYGLLDAMFDGTIPPMEIKGIFLPDDKTIKYFESFIKKNEKVINKTMLKYNIDISDKAGDINIDEGNIIFWTQMHAVLTAIKNGEITHPIIYANSNARIVRFMAILEALAPEYGVKLDYTNIFTHKDKSIEGRIAELEGPFTKAKVGIVGNVYCLQEGISINAIDSVILIDPRTTGPAIIQILGRASRWDKLRKKISKVYLPIILKEKDGKIQLDEDYFILTTDWILNLVSADSDIAKLIIPTKQDEYGFNDNKRKGIDIRDIKPPKKRGGSASGANRKQPITTHQLREIDWERYMKTASYKTIVSTLISMEKRLSVPEGKEEQITNLSKTFLNGYKTNIENAIRNYNPTQHKKYLPFIKSKKALIEEFALINNVETEVSGSHLEKEGLCDVVRQSEQLKRMNILESFNNL